MLSTSWLLPLAVLGLIGLLYLCSAVLRTVTVRTKVSRRVKALAPAQGAKTPQTALFSWQQEQSWLQQTSQRFGQRFDALYGVSGKKVVVISAAVVCLACWFYIPTESASLKLIAAALAMIVGLGGSYVYLGMQQRKAFEKSFPQVLNQLSRAVMVGVTVPEAIGQIAVSHRGLIAQEFTLIKNKLEIGMDLKQALAEANHRLPYSGFHFFTVALTLNQDSGGQLRSILNSLSRTLHDNSTIKMKARSLTAEPRITMVILVTLVLSLVGYMIYKTPDNIDLLLSTESGNAILLYIVASMSAGIGIISYLTKVKL
ncbi:type II secretion system F family protein [Vibrio sp. Of7-15]|uniref:type II secretion system F family protein n=1 Tax=Vibrio sp. Of7-15 TaxID=2724879 RepID=UPI001EF1B567|nr:type II secretion system F family protein [Vibrio sp. Of7-15]MCG7496164.1 type II secretion system F family protein [Vibrio sp. Of7-15]